MQKPALFFPVLWLYFLAVLACPAWGEDQANVSPEMQAALKAMQASRQIGPADIPLNGQAVLKLPEGYVFVPTPAASDYMRATGNSLDAGFQGLIFPNNEEENWLVFVDYEDSGYIKDDDAKTWNVDELLESYRKGTEEGNAERVKHGFPELEVGGWVEKPVYDPTTHRLVWSMAVNDKGDTSEKNKGVNYNTYALGREGYFSMNLATDLDAIEGFKPRAQELLASLQFNNGKNYADFNESTDKVAEYGLAALVGGIAAKKLGLLALGAAFFAKFAKLLIAGFVVFGAAIRKMFQRNSQD